MFACRLDKLSHGWTWVSVSVMGGHISGNEGYIDKSRRQEFINQINISLPLLPHGCMARFLHGHPLDLTNSSEERLDDKVLSDIYSSVDYKSRNTNAVKAIDNSPCTQFSREPERILAYRTIVRKTPHVHPYCNGDIRRWTDRLVHRVHQLFRPRVYETSVLLVERLERLAVHFHVRHTDSQSFLYILREGLAELPSRRVLHSHIR